MVAMGVLSACGGSDSDSSQDAGTTEEATDEVVEPSDAGDTDGEGLEVEQGSGTDLPDDFPSGIPLPEEGGPTLTSTFRQDGFWTLVYEMQDTSPEVCNGYLDRFVEAGFEETVRADSSGDLSGLYSSDDYDIVVGCGPSGGITLQVGVSAG